MLAEVPDPRNPHGTRYKIGVILAFTVCAMLCGARSLYAIAQWGRDHSPEVTRALGFKESTPCVATLHLLFKRLDRDKLETILGQYFQQQGLAGGEAIAIDGKSLRGIHGEQLPGVHPVAAYAHKAGRVLGCGPTFPGDLCLTGAIYTNIIILVLLQYRFRRDPRLP